MGRRTDVNDPARLRLTDTPPMSSGKYAVEITAQVGAGTERAQQWFMPGSRVHARWYCPPEISIRQPHALVHLLANRADNKWSAFGKAGSNRAALISSPPASNPGVTGDAICPRGTALHLSHGHAHRSQDGQILSE